MKRKIIYMKSNERLVICLPNGVDRISVMWVGQKAIIENDNVASFWDMAHIPALPAHIQGQLAQEHTQ